MLVAGMMSGTSADGIDVAIVEISGIEWRTKIRLVAHHFVPYPPKVRKRVLEIAGGATAPVAEISQLNVLLGELLANACSIACNISGITLNKISLIGSHGQTIYHQPDASSCCGISTRSTFQIGEPAVIAARTGVTTVADFRPADMAVGGQGAPLVPFFDYIYYRHPKIGRVILNIGGIANITAIPANGSPEQVVAFDTGPGNMLMDALANLATDGKKQYDKSGKLAASGRIDDEVVARLMKLPYFKLKPPKSTGREQYGSDFLKKHFLNSIGRHPARSDLSHALATATAFTAESIAGSIANHVLPNFLVEECFVSGGGVKNQFLMEQLRTRLTRNHLHSINSRLRLIDNYKITVYGTDREDDFPQAKEAIAFAVLAYHTFRGKPSNIPSATGAMRQAVLGKIITANPV